MDIWISQFFEAIRTPFLDVIACIFSLFGEALFLVLLICVLYWLADKSWGERAVVTAFSAMAFCNFFKGIFQRTRPYAAGVVTRVEVDNPFLSTMNLNSSLSFPSGHSTMGGGLFFATALRFEKRKWLWVLCPFLTLGVMASRLYLGVHYFTDVLAGASLGILVAVIWDMVYRYCPKKKHFVLVGFALLSIVFCILEPSKSAIEQCGMLCAAAIALPVEEKFVNFQNAKGTKNRLFRALVGLACVGLIFGLFSYLPFAFLELLGWKFVKYFLTVLVGALLVPYLFKRLKI
ncbi:MAG: phosphatase PAP2 family protein [Clostridia bacterium]|nr:phosphatase PAP2 family protein [Clostridia bacterium]